MSDLLTRLEAHRAAGHASPGFHLSGDDIDKIIRGLRAAAEIERLRQQLWLVREDLAHLIQQMDSWSGKGAQK